VLFLAIGISLIVRDKAMCKRFFFSDSTTGELGAWAPSLRIISLGLLIPTLSSSPTVCVAHAQNGCFS